MSTIRQAFLPDKAFTAGETRETPCPREVYIVPNEDRKPKGKSVDTSLFSLNTVKKMKHNTATKYAQGADGPQIGWARRLSSEWCQGSCWGKRRGKGIPESTEKPGVDMTVQKHKFCNKKDIFKCISQSEMIM